MSYRYIVDIRYNKGIECEDPCTVHNHLEHSGYEPKFLQDNGTRTELLIEFKTIEEADTFALGLNELKKELSPGCTVDCYVVSGVWRV